LSWTGNRDLDEEGKLRDRTRREAEPQRKGTLGEQVSDSASKETLSIYSNGLVEPDNCMPGKPPLLLSIGV